MVEEAAAPRLWWPLPCMGWVGADILAICLFEELAIPWDAQRERVTNTPGTGVMRSRKESRTNEKTEFSDSHAG